MSAPPLRPALAALAALALVAACDSPGGGGPLYYADLGATPDAAGPGDAPAVTDSGGATDPGPASDPGATPDPGATTDPGAATDPGGAVDSGPGCTDECAVSGATSCAGNGVVTCGQHDGDPCLELSAPQACAGDQTCVDGACATACASDCTEVDALRCAPEGAALQACLDDGEGCLTWSTPSPCPGVANGSATCAEGACGLACDQDYTLIDGACVACPAPAASGDLVINELMPDPDGLDMNGDLTYGAVDDEWVELVNLSGGSLSLEGVTVLSGPSAAELSVQHTFAPACLPAGHALVVFGGGELGLSQPSGATLLIGDGSLSLNNGGDTVAVQAADGTTLDLMTYTSPPAGVSLARDPDGSGDFVDHDLTSAGTAYSIGACLDGAAFPGCLP